MIVKAWNNGAHHTDGNGYRVKIKRRGIFMPEVLHPSSANPTAMVNMTW